MREDRYCEVCGRPYAELHHIIHRSAASYLTNISLNFKFLCYEHHRGNDSPHMKRSIDRKYKLEYQDKVKSLVNNDKCYTEKELIDILHVTKTEVRKFTKKLTLTKEGYKGEEIILRLLGGRYYCK